MMWRACAKAVRCGPVGGVSHSCSGDEALMDVLLCCAASSAGSLVCLGLSNV
jgi:hypothetical protein